METLRAFLKSLGDDAARDAFAARCGTTAGHLRNASYGQRTLAPEVVCAIERESGGALTCQELRPDLPWRRLEDASWLWHEQGRPLLDVTIA